MSHRNPGRIIALLIGAACWSGTLFAQTVEPAAGFEVADVHPSPNSTNPDAYDTSGGLMRGGLYYLKRSCLAHRLQRRSAHSCEE